MKLTLQSQIKQKELDLLANELNEKRAPVLEKNQELLALNAEMARNQQILAALKTEQEELAKQAKETLTDKALSMDSYLAVRTQDSDLKYKIEYCSALIEEQEMKKEVLQETIFDLRESFIATKNKIYDLLGKTLLNEFLQQHGDELRLIQYLLIHSKQFSVYAGDNEELAKSFLSSKLKVSLEDFSPESLKEFQLAKLALDNDFKPKAPTKRYAEQFSGQPARGFAKLINKITE